MERATARQKSYTVRKLPLLISNNIAATVQDFASNIKMVFNSLPSPPIVIAHSLSTMYMTKLFNDASIKGTHDLFSGLTAI